MRKKKKSQLHSELAHKRWDKISKNKRSEIMSELAKARWRKKSAFMVAPKKSNSLEE